MIFIKLPVAHSAYPVYVNAHEIRCIEPTSAGRTRIWWGDGSNQYHDVVLTQQEVLRHIFDAPALALLTE